MEKNIMNQLIGKRLKQLRDERHLSLDQVAVLTGVSKPMLGQIERAQSNPTVSTLWKIATGLGVSFTAFIDDKQPEAHIVREADITPLKEADGSYVVYPIFPMAMGRPFEMYTVECQPGCRYISKSHPEGVEEFLWGMEGLTQIITDGKTYQIGENEGLSFKADRKHEYYNPSDKASKLVMIIYYS